MQKMVTVTVSPNARRERFVADSDAKFSIDVREPAEDNRANMRVRELLALHFGVTVSRIRFVSGMRGKKKRFAVVL